MNKFYIFLLLLPSLLFAQIKIKKPKVLFIGNSYTYVNYLPQLVHDIAVAAGDTLIFDSSCPGGYTFLNHAIDPNTIAKINWGKWDYVVLQAQSQEPSFSPAQVNAQTLPYAIALDTMIKNHNPCATTVFYETWGRKFGDASNCASYPPVCTYTGMQNRLKQSYLLFADTCHALFSPAGEAFRKSIALNPNLELYQSDQSHPSLEGSYLTACVFYEMLYQKSVLTNSFNPGIGTATLTFLQQTAHGVVQDSLALWHVGQYIPKAGFSQTVQANAVNFNANFQYLNHTWYFGDGTSNMGYQLQHNYTSPGIKIVSHVVDDGCKRDSVSAQVSILYMANHVETYHKPQLLLISPNPANKYCTLTLPNFSQTDFSEVEVCNVLGEKNVLQVQNNSIDVSLLTEGLYFISIKKDNQFFQTKLMVRH